MKRQKYFNRREYQELKAVIEEKTGYRLKSDYVLSQAFRRRSYSAEFGGKSNEMFEFLGDQILSYYVVKIVSDHCVSRNIEGDYSFRIGEKLFTELKHKYVSNETFAKIVDEWGIAEYMMIGKCDKDNGVLQQTKVKADLFEAIIGAIAVDSDWNATVLENAVKKALNLEERLYCDIRNVHSSVAVNIDNSVTVLKELAEREECSMPEYKFFEIGVDTDGNPVWSCSAVIVNSVTGITRVVDAHSKKDAKKAAAYLLLCEHLQIQNQYGITDSYPCWTYSDGKLFPIRNKINKLEMFLENAKILSDNFGIIPLLYGSMGLEYLSGKDIGSDDIDVLVPRVFVAERWQEFRNVLEAQGYVLKDLHEHTFVKNGIEYSYADIEDLETFVSVTKEDIRTTEMNGVRFMILSPEQYLAVYKKSINDGYRINVRKKKDDEKIKFIENVLLGKSKTKGEM